ncbi:MAG: GNAT family N-acetyltransferase [Bryobacterales bacterium]|nr:GNAT family N-acetyltransferase [Bryobacterales bacterium]
MIEIRDLTQRAEFDEAVELQQRIWGFSDIETIPVRFFVVASKIGGQVLGAFDGDRMVAFLLAVPGIKQGGLHYLHSHMLGVLPEYRDHGLGRKLKFRQREQALSRGIQLIEWTFDPLEPRNAFFNFERLGVIVRRYVENQYGRTSSVLHTGLPTDRFVAEWWLQNERVTRVIAGEANRPSKVVERLPLPANISLLRREEPAVAREAQLRLAAGCHQAFADGLAIVSFERTETDFGYLLTKWQ